MAWASQPLEARQLVAERIVLSGHVQGQGLRPAVCRIATGLALCGSVCNTSDGVEILASGTAEQLDQFAKQLSAVLRAEVNRRRVSINASRAEQGFAILPSDCSGALRTAVPLDMATCSDCFADFDQADDHRYGYPLITCAVCGPRYSVLRRMPFDRSATSMDVFCMCSRCRAEYESICDRRFHAQTIACAECGPRCWVTDAGDQVLDFGETAVALAAERIRQGQIVALRGVGGYQLVCDASNDQVVTELRQRKLRPTKPLAVMLADLTDVSRWWSLSNAECNALGGPGNPIVLLRGKPSDGLASGLAPGLDCVGVMLPTTALHLQLLRHTQRPLVVTSANLSGDPIITSPDVAMRQLKAVADLFLHHNRQIVRAVDDSVVQCIGTKTMTLRAARGFAPMVFSCEAAAGTFATGGHQKVTVAISTGRDLVLSPHIGEMDTENGRLRFERTSKDICELYDMETTRIAHDLHPEYFTTGWARRQASQSDAIQHHHAHVAASMLEAGLLEETVLGVAFDGTGLGEDGTLWGGEFLIATRSCYRRAGHLRPFRLPGGELAIKQPWRTAYSLLSQLEDKRAWQEWIHQHDASAPIEAFTAALERAPLSSSMGRLFDAIASIVLGIKCVHYEGEAAMRLEAACDLEETCSYTFEMQPGNPWQLDWRPVLQAILEERNSLGVERVAMRFHRAIAKAIVEVAKGEREYPCVVTGGVFQNRTLLELLSEETMRAGVEVRLPGRVPVNDGGLALGQLLIATSD